MRYSCVEQEWAGDAGVGEGQVWLVNMGVEAGSPSCHVTSSKAVKKMFMVLGGDGLGG